MMITIPKSALLCLAVLPSFQALSISRRTPPKQRPVIVQLFEWTWDSIAAECTSFIGPAGYGYVQVSPPQEHWQGQGQWYTSYQPVSYNLNSKRGNRDQFSRMVRACHSAGVGVVVDTLLNHMSAQESGTGSGGTKFTKYEYPGTYDYQNFHHNCGTDSEGINDYRNRNEVQRCELVGLADLATDTDAVRGKLAAYINDLISLGADGLRLDAAKHIPTDDIAQTLARTSKPLYITQEVVWGEGEGVQPYEYEKNGDVQEFRFTTAIRDAFNNGNITGLIDINNRGWVPSSSANAFVANHDTERNGQSLTPNSPNNLYTLAHVFALSFPYGTPTILSSFQFSSFEQGAPRGGSGTCAANGGQNGFYCQHRWASIAGMVGFFNQVNGMPIVQWISDSPSQIAFGRGSSGFVVINAGRAVWSKVFATSLPDGVYCDVLRGHLQGGPCTGPTVTVSGGTFKASMGPFSAIAIHTGASQ